MSNLVINIASEFTGKKAFGQAGKSVSSLDKAVGKLGKQIAGVFAVSQVTRFAKASVKAFIEDEAAATRLASAVKNLGLAFEQPEIDSYIKKLEASSAIADDSLRPALQALLTTTGSLAESQKILGIALDVSRGSGRELTQVTQDLAQAYVGNTRGLRKYNLGLTQAELKTMSFAEVQARLIKQFSGSNAAYLDTYAGKLSVLTVAAGNAQETIGKGLVDALVILGGKDQGIQNIADSMATVATEVGNITRGLAVMFKQLESISVISGIVSALIQTIMATPIGRLLKMAADKGTIKPRANRSVTGRTNVTLYDADAIKAKKLEAERLRLLAAQAKAQKALTAEQKKQALAKKQSSLFDIEQIQLVAALQGKLTNEERIRAELQLALLTGNSAEADKLSHKLAMSIDSTGALARSLKELPDANNPFKAWDAYLDAILAKAKLVAGAGSGFGGSGGGGGGGGGGGATVQTNAVAAAVFNNLGSANASTTTAAEAARLFGGMGSSQPTIVVQIDGQAIATAVQNQGLNGNNPIVDRLLGNFK
jgi:hypothetical protein